MKKQIADLKNDYARAYADTENLKKRLNAEAEQIRKYRIQSFAKEILPVIDNLERALQTEVNEVDEGFKKGVEMTYNQLIAALKNEGVEVIDCLNKQFDPNYHQAIMQEKKEGVESGIVIEVLQNMLQSYILEEQRNKKVEERVFKTLEGEDILVEFSNKTKATNPLVKDYQNILKTLTIIRKEIREVEIVLEDYANEESDVNN